MLLLVGTVAALKLITDAAVTVDTHVSYSDTTASGTPSTDVNYQNQAINSATTTTICNTPGVSGKARNISYASIRNRSAASNVTVTVLIDDGTQFQLDSRTLGPGQSLQYTTVSGWFVNTNPGPLTRPYFGKVYGAYGSCDPGELMYQVQRAGWIGPTPTNIGATVARCSLFIPPADIVVNRIRVYGIGAVSGIYTVALYRMSDLARLTSSITFSTTANTWTSIGSALALTLSKDTAYFIACSANTTGVTAGVAAFGTTTTATTGQIQSTPGGLPGNLALGATNYLTSYQFQFAVTAGAMPNPAATLALPAAWTGGMPAFWLDNQDV